MDKKIIDMICIDDLEKKIDNSIYIGQYQCCNQCYLGPFAFWHLIEEHYMTVYRIYHFMRALDIEFKER